VTSIGNETQNMFSKYFCPISINRIYIQNIMQLILDVYNYWIISEHGREGEYIPPEPSSPSSPPTPMQIKVSPSSSVKKQLNPEGFSEEMTTYAISSEEEVTATQSSTTLFKQSIHARKGVEPLEDIAEESVMTTHKLPSVSTTTPFSTVINSSKKFPMPPTGIPSTTKSSLFNTVPKSFIQSTTASLIKTSTIITSPSPPMGNDSHQHFRKPEIAVDAVKTQYNNSAPVIAGLSFGFILIVVVAVLAYKKLQDVWSRRHYDRMDFLIDGMYDL